MQIPTVQEVRRANYALAAQGPVPLAWLVDEIPELKGQILSLANLQMEAFTRAKSIFVLGLALGMAIEQARETEER